MHETLFRGKRVDNGEWVYGYYANCGRPRGKTNYTYHFIIEYPGKPKDYHEVYTTTIEEYIGMTDKNGKKIFEGDLVKYEGDIFKIKYIDDSATFATRPVNNMKYSPYITSNSVMRMEVVGNIHDNPELLEVR